MNDENIIIKDPILNDMIVQLNLKRIEKNKYFYPNDEDTIKYIQELNSVIDKAIKYIIQLYKFEVARGLYE